MEPTKTFIGFKHLIQQVHAGINHILGVTGFMVPQVLDALKPVTFTIIKL